MTGPTFINGEPWSVVNARAMKMKRPKGKPQPRKPPDPQPARGRGPVTNRRKGNRAITPAKGAQFVERKAPKLRRVAVDDPGPEDVSGFDTCPNDDDREFFNARFIEMDDDEP